MNELKIEYIDISELQPNEYNPKKMTEKEAKDLENSIVKFGIVDPIVVNSADNRKNIIIGGHQRYKIYKKLGFKKIPVVYINIPDLVKEEELCLRLSKNVGEWDWDMLANFEGEFLLDIGFNTPELDDIFQLESRPNDDAIPEEPSETDIKLGDLYRLGRHLLLCGDVTKVDNINKLIGNNIIRLGFVDPPYNIGFDYWDYIGSIKTDEYKDWCKSWFFTLREISQITLLTIGQWNLKMWLDIAEPLGMICWVAKNKTSGSKISLFSIWEPILVYAKKILKKRINKADLVEGLIVRSDTEFLDDVNEAMLLVEQCSDYIEISNIRQKNVGVHKCPKQVKLLTKLIERYTDRNDNVLDLFGGSGTTLIACEKLDRVCFMAEIEPIYCDIIIKRWEDFTGKKAEKVNG